MKRLMMLSLAVMLAGCGATPYHKGYSGSQLSPTEFRIDARVDGFSPSSRAEDIAMLRAAEIACIRGYSSFDLISERMWLEGQLTYKTITIQIRNDDGQYDARFIMDSLKKDLDAKTQCSF